MSSTVSIINLERFKGTCLFSIGLKRWGNRAGIKDMAALQAYIKQLEVELAEEPDEAKTAKPAASVILASDRVKSTKVLIKSKTYDALNRELNEIKQYCLARSMPSFFRAGMFVVKTETVPELEKFLREANEKLRAPDGALTKFLEAYPADVETARTEKVRKGGLGPLFRQGDYPELAQLEKLWALEWFWLALSVPENIPAELREQAGEKFTRRLLDAADGQGRRFSHMQFRRW